MSIYENPLNCKNNCINPVFNKCNFYFNCESVKNIEKTSNEILSFSNIINIIVSDDEALIRQSTIRTLKNVSKSLNLNVNIIETVDGVETLSLVYKYLNMGTKISLIFSDENMNCMNGTKSCDLIKELLVRKKSEDIPFYMLTACEGIVSNPNSRCNVTRILEKPLERNVAIEILKKFKN
jgi:response regulator RpfG family c-di-GMP phosphodiesterase